MGYALVFVVLILFYVPTLSAMALTGMKSLVCSLRKREIVAICLLSIVFLATIMALMARERYIYFWDFGAYWYKTLQFQNTLSSSAMDILRNLIYSVETADYNNIVCAIIALPLKLFGSSYFAFVLLNVAMFYIPNAFFMAFVFCKVLEKHSLAEVRIVWVYGYTLLFSVALFPVLAGYVDIVGMLPLTSSFLLVIDREFEQVDIAKDICLGASLLWVMLLRRYYAYAVVGGAVFAFFYWFTYGATFKKPFFRLKNKIIDMLLSIAVPVIVLVTVFPNYIIRSLLNNHSSAYSAYKTAGLVGEWIKFARYFGIFFIALMIVGVLYGIWRKAGRLTVGLLLNLAVTCTLFFRIQNMGQHHYYIAVFPMCCLIFLGVYALLSVCTKEAFLAWGVRSLIVFVIVGNFLMSIGIGTSYKSALWVERTYVPRV